MTKVATSSVVKEHKGRAKGTPNKASLQARKMAEDMGVDPLEFLLKVVRGDIADATVDNQIIAAKEAIKYIYQQLKAVEHSGGIEARAETLEEFIKRQDEIKGNK